MSKSGTIWLVVVIVVIIVGVVLWMGYGGSAMNPAPTGTGATTTTGGTSNGGSTGTASGTGGTTQTLTLNTSNSPTLGTYLVATNGMTLYKFANDRPGVSTCTGTCASIWLPYTVQSSSSLAGALAVTGKIGTISRPNGALQVTYNNAPLYFYKNDSAPGDTKGQGIANL